MADNWVQGSFAFHCTASELALLEEVASAATALAWDEPLPEPSAALLAAFPPTEPDDRLSGFRDAFADPDYPTIGADFIGEAGPDGPDSRIASFASMDSFDPMAIATVIQCCCAETLRGGPIGFEWAVACSKPRIGEFGGGWCAIFADRVEIETTGEALARSLAEGVL